MKKLPGMRLPTPLRAAPALLLLAATPAWAAGRGTATMGVSCRVVRSARVSVSTAPAAAPAPATPFLATVNGRPESPVASVERVAPDGTRYAVVTVLADASPR